MSIKCNSMSKNSTKIILYCLFSILSLFTLVSMQSCNSDSTSINNLLGINYNSKKTTDSLLLSLKKDTLSIQKFLIDAIDKNDLYAQMMSYKFLGVIYRDNYQFEQAIETHKLFLSLSMASNDSIHMIQALNKLGNDYRERGIFGESSKYYFEIIGLTDVWEEEARNNVKLEIANAFCEIGGIYMRLHQPDDAEYFLNESYKIYESTKNLRGLARNLVYLGDINQMREEYDSAFYYYDKSLLYGIDLNSVARITSSFNRIGSMYLKKADYENALLYANSAYNTISKTADKINWLESCNLLGQIYTELGNYREAQKYLDESLNLTKLVDIPYHFGKIHMLRAQLYEKQNKTIQAAEENALNRYYTDIIYNENSLTRISNMRLSYEMAKNDNKISSLNYKYNLKVLQQRKMLFFSLILLAIIVLIFSFIYSKNIIKKRKSESMIQLEKLRADFFMHITHEFRTPVSIIMGLVDMLKKNLKDGETKKNTHDLNIIENQSHNLMFLLEEILSYSKFQSSKGVIKYKNGDIVTYLRYLFDCFSVFAETKEINYVFYSNVKELIIDYPEEYLRIIVNNLLSNSIKHSSKSDRIILLFRKDENLNKYVIEVSDTGDGIPSEQLPHIFKEFNQGESKNKVFGSGIGLALTKELITILNGTIDVRSEIDVETVFTITLPYSRKSETISEKDILSDSENAKKQNTKEDLTQKEFKVMSFSENTKDSNFIPHISDDSLSNSTKPLLLVVEDSKDLSYYLCSVLKDNYNVITADNGKEGLKLVNNYVPDLIISDIMMPLMDGLEFCKKVRDSIVTSHIPIIILSSKTSSADRMDSLRHGADAFITKPFVEEELKVIIGQLLKNRKQLRDKYTSIITDNQRPKESGNNKDIAFLQKVTDITYREIANHDFFPQGLADELFISTSQLNRKLKAMSGLNCSNYVLKVRLSKAKKLLLKSSKPIGDIAMECGFNDFAYFSRSFKSEFSMSPTQYKRLIRKEDIN